MRVAILIGAPCRVTAGKAPPPSAIAKAVSDVRIAEPIQVDGLLDETAWGRAAPATDFVQQQPDDGQPAAHRTEVRFLYHAATLYVGAVLYDEAQRDLVLPRRAGVDSGGGVLAVPSCSGRSGGIIRHLKGWPERRGGSP